MYFGGTSHLVIHVITLLNCIFTYSASFQAAKEELVMDKINSTHGTNKPGNAGKQSFKCVLITYALVTALNYISMLLVSNFVIFFLCTNKRACNKDDDINNNVLFNALSFFCEYGTFLFPFIRIPSTFCNDKTFALCILSSFCVQYFYFANSPIFKVKL